MKRSLGRQEAALLAYAQLRGTSTLRAGDLIQPLKISPTQETKLFSRMSRSALIARVRPGLYLVPPRLPLGGAWSPDEMVVLDTFMKDLDAKFQICGPNAFNKYGFDEQVPNRIYVYNNRMFGERSIGSVILSLIKVTDDRLGSIEEVKTTSGAQIPYSSRTRALMDAVYDWDRFSSLPRAYDWIRKELKSGRVTPAGLAETTIQYGNQGTIRRIGLILETTDGPPNVLRKLEKSLKNSDSIIPLVPGFSRKGTINKRWGIILTDTHS